MNVEQFSFQNSRSARSIRSFPVRYISLDYTLLVLLSLFDMLFLIDKKIIAACFCNTNMKNLNVELQLSSNQDFSEWLKLFIIHFSRIQILKCSGINKIIYTCLQK